ncbi:2-keto-4-pentenoate hydratase [Kribbella sp. NPDC051620]|uniref:2-keto-4-pentenoate hydratase n=1 Tax=Kribbella sp. NPDC051620 TaxID=3364120 RepID=UPI0037BD4D6E
MSTATISQAAARLSDAASSRTGCAPVRDLIGAGDLDAAYAVQEELTRQRLAAGRHIVGRKIGLTSPVVQQQLGVGQPDFGVLFDDMFFSDTDTVSLDSFVSPRVEGEVAFVLSRDIENPNATIIDVLAATGFLLPAIEIVDSRVTGWDITIADTIADNASSGAFALGTTAVDPVGLDLTEVALRLEHRGVVISSGSGAACLGSPVRAVAWLAREGARRGRPLLAGEVVLSGALGPMIGVSEPGTYRADISGLGHVEVTFERNY